MPLLRSKFKHAVYIDQLLEWLDEAGLVLYTEDRKEWGNTHKNDIVHILNVKKELKDIRDKLDSLKSCQCVGKNKDV